MQGVLIVEVRRALPTLSSGLARGSSYPSAASHVGHWLARFESMTYLHPAASFPEDPASLSKSFALSEAAEAVARDPAVRAVLVELGSRKLARTVPCHGSISTQELFAAPPGSRESGDFAVDYVKHGSADGSKASEEIASAGLESVLSGKGLLMTNYADEEAAGAAGPASASAVAAAVASSASWASEGGAPEDDGSVVLCSAAHQPRMGCPGVDTGTFLAHLIAFAAASAVAANAAAEAARHASGYSKHITIQRAETAKRKAAESVSSCGTLLTAYCATLRHSLGSTVARDALQVACWEAGRVLLEEESTEAVSSACLRVSRSLILGGQALATSLSRRSQMDVGQCMVQCVSNALGAAEPSWALVLIAKPPVPGHSKTRLAAALGSPSQAVAVAEAMLQDTLEVFGEKSGETGFCRIVYSVGASDESAGVMAKLVGSDWELVEHPGRGTLPLSEVLTSAYTAARTRVSGPVVFIGADIPDLLPSHVLSSLPHAWEGTATLVPARDGGYAALTLPPSANAGTVFAGVDWSVSWTLASQMVALQRDPGVARVVVSDQVCQDVDTVSDLAKLARQGPRLAAMRLEVGAE
jgi:uncharacterized protein